MKPLLCTRNVLAAALLAPTPAPCAQAGEVLTMEGAVALALENDCAIRNLALEAEGRYCGGHHDSE